MKISKILCAVNDDPLAESVFDLAFELAEKLGSEIALVSILDQGLLRLSESGVTVDTLRASLKQEINRLFDRLLARRKEPNVFRFLEEGDPKKLIVGTANNWEADLIVIASHGRKGLARALVGSVAESVMRQSKCPVLVVPTQK
ncbi:MAG: universal stress protein [Bdellovibrionales bacterium]